MLHPTKFPAVPIPVPGPPVKKRRRDENNVNIPAAAVIEDVKEVCRKKQPTLRVTSLTSEYF